MSAALGRTLFKLNLEKDQAVSFGGEVWKYRGRASDRERRLLFDNADQLVRDFTDRELIQHQVDGKLRYLTLVEKEALGRKHAGGRARVIMDSCGPLDKAHIDRVRSYVRGWERAGRPSRTIEALEPVIVDVAHEIGDHAAPSVRTFQRWIKLSEETGADPEAFVKQVANQGNYDKRHDPVLLEMIEDWVHKHYLVEPRKTLPYVFAMVKEELKEHNKPLPLADRLPMVGRATIYQIMRAVDRYTETYCHRGREEADHKFRMVEDGPVTERHNECWEIDHTTVDLIVIDHRTELPIGRPFITMAIDRHTRLIAGYYVSWDFPGIVPTIECLRNAALPKDSSLAKAKGVRNPWPAFNTPSQLVSDNAKHFYSKSYKEVCRNLGIDPARAPLKKAWFKGRIERMFGTYVRGLCHMVPGTSFSNIFQRLKEKPPEKVAACTLAEFDAMLVRFIVDIYHTRRHRILNTSPLIAYQESMRLHGMKRPLNPDELASKLSIPYWRTVQREGLLFENLWYRGPELIDLMVDKKLSRTVKIKVDPQDLTHIWFIHPATNKPVKVGIQKSMETKIRGITLDVHRLALSMQRANTDCLAGEDGISEAYGIIAKALEDKVRGNGLENRRLSAKHLDKLRARAEAYATQDAPEPQPLDPLEEVEISEELLAQVTADAEPTNLVPFTGSRVTPVPAPPPEQTAAPVPVAAPKEKKPPASKKPDAPDPPPKPPVPDLVEDDDVDFDDLVKSHTTVTKDDDHE